MLFDPETAVLADVAFAEELTLLQHLRAIDLRGKFDYRQTSDRQFSDHPEDRLGRNWQLIGNLNVTARSTLRLLWGREDQNRYSQETGTSARRSYVTLARRYEAGWTWRPDTDLRLGLQAELLDRQDDVSDVTQQETALRPTGRYRIKRAWTVQVDLRLAEVKSEAPPAALAPWFFPRPGRNVESSLRLAWEPSQYPHRRRHLVRAQARGSEVAA